MTPDAKDQLAKSTRERIEKEANVWWNSPQPVFIGEAPNDKIRGYQLTSARGYIAGATHEALRAQRLEKLLAERDARIIQLSHAIDCLRGELP